MVLFMVLFHCLSNHFPDWKLFKISSFRWSSNLGKWFHIRVKGLFANNNFTILLPSVSHSTIYSLFPVSICLQVFQGTAHQLFKRKNVKKCHDIVFTGPTYFLGFCWFVHFQATCDMNNKLRNNKHKNWLLSHIQYMIFTSSLQNEVRR